jgi:hypothetical protein
MITLLSFVLSIILWSTSYDYPFVLCDVYHSVKYVIWLPFCPLCCLSFCELRHMITPCVVCHSVNYVIWLPCVLSVILWITSYDYPVCCLSFCELLHMITLCVVCHSVNYVIWLPFCPLWCLSFCEVRDMITLLSFVLPVILWITSYDYQVCCLSFCELPHMITLLVSSYFSNNILDGDFCFLSSIFVFNIQINTNIHCF